MKYGLPRIADSKRLAKLLGVNTKELQWLCNPVVSHRRKFKPKSSKHYTTHWIKKKTRGWRLIEAPKSRLKSVQRIIVDTILNRVPVHPLSCGFSVGKNILDYAKPHVGRAICLKMDLDNFFMHINTGRAWGLFRRIGYCRFVSHQLALLVTVAADDEAFAEHDKKLGVERIDPRLESLLRSRHLPQGAPTSPAIANLCAFGLDSRLSGLARSIGGVHYTRYADDLLLSGNLSFGRHLDRLPSFIGGIAIEEGFQVNFHKTRVMYQSQQQKSGGIVLNSRVNLCRKEYDLLKATLFNCIQSGPASQNRHGHAHFREHLLGRIKWLTQLNPRKARKLSQLFEQIEFENG